MRASLLLALACLLPGFVPPARAAAEEAVAPLHLEGAPAIVTPPPAGWTRRTEAVVAGQWLVEWRSPVGGAFVRAHVFPVRADREPEPLLVRAVDIFLRGLGVDGFGMPGRRLVIVWGGRAAQAELGAVVGGVRVAGHARLLLASRHHWAFAVGYAPTSAPPALHEAVAAFVESLEPLEPRFYARTFHRPAEADAVLVRVAGEPPLTEGHLDAVRALLEAGLGVRFPLALRPLVRDVLLEEARSGAARTREGFRVSAEAFDELVKASSDESRAAMRTLGKRILQAILDRAGEGRPHAQRFAGTWRGMQRLAVGEADDGLTQGAASHVIEASAFLASVAADHAVPLDEATRRRLATHLTARWPQLAPMERTALRRSGATWAALRYAWDRADPEHRRLFRRAVVARLAAPEKRAAVGALEPGRPLMRWMRARPRAGLDAALLDAALDLPATAWRALVETLAVEDAFGLHPGW